MANALESKLVVTNPDFDTIKTNLKNFLKSQSTFSDYDFEGSGLSNLIDLLAYNTHYLAFYVNMLGNESFLDTASVRDSVVSHAKMLGYTPSSTTSAIARANVVFTLANNPAIAGMTSLTIPRFTKFSSSAIDGVNYTFSNLEEVTVNKINNSFSFNNLIVTEGTPVNYVYTFDQLTNPKQEFEIADAGVDTATLQVIIQNSAVDLTQRTFIRAQNATEVDADSLVYYLEETKGNKYKIYFGDNIIGKALTDGNLVILSYLISSGPAANKATNLTLLDTVGGLSVGTITMVQAAAGGTLPESLDKIKFTAPKTFISNNRAVTKNDYINLIKKNYPSLEAVNVWGGEENVPPVYGKVFISAKPAAGYEITLTEKQYILDQIVGPLSVVTVTPEFIDPDYNYLNLNVKVTYDPSMTTRAPGEIQNIVKAAIYNFADRELNTFNSYFKISRLMRDIDNSETSILSNSIDIKIEKRIEPVIGLGRTYKIKFYTPLTRDAGKNRISSYPAFKTFDQDDNLRSCFYEEVPVSFTGISKVNVLLGGSGLLSAPRLEVIGDGRGAKLEAIITNGKVTSVNVVSAGSEYSTIDIKAYDIDNKEIPNIVLEGVIDNRIGRLRSYYYNDNEVKTILEENSGTINYGTGEITINNLAPVDIENDLKILYFYATPEDYLFTSERNSIITIDQTDLAAITVEAVQVR